MFYGLHILICCDTLTFPYRTYSIIQSILSCSFPQVHTSSSTTQNCQPNNMPISVFASLICWKTLDICILFSSFLFFFGNTNASECWKYVLISSHHTCLNMKKGSEGHRAAKIIFYLISPSNLPIRRATISGCSILSKNRMLKFDFGPLQGDDVPIHMLTIYVRSCDVYIFVFPSGTELGCDASSFSYRGLEKVE